MKLLLSLSVFALALLSFPGHAQTRGYRYSRPLDSLKGTWHHVELPPDMYRKVNESLTDIRILGVTDSGDTIEAPYILKSRGDAFTSSDVSLSLRNRSSRGGNFYVTVVMKEAAPINELELGFDRPNFEWRVMLEGSTDEKAWYVILSDYRILSIDNEQTRFKFTRLAFPEASYPFYRITIASPTDPQLTRVTANRIQKKKGRFHTFDLARKTQVENPQTRETKLDVQLNGQVPVTHVRFRVRETFDYYRPFSISFLKDSFKTDQGWQRRYETLFNGTLNSIEAPNCSLPRAVTDRLTLTVENRNDQPLHIDSVFVGGMVDELVFRTTEPARYSLYYGKRASSRPRYDVESFLDRIPEETQPVVAGPEIDSGTAASQEALFTNRAWLWSVMGVIILLLGWFTLRMLRKTKE